MSVLAKPYQAVIAMTVGQSSFASWLSAKNFAPENSKRIKKIGFVTIAWTLVSPILQYFGGQIILSEHALSVPGIQLIPAFDISGMAIFTGVAMISSQRSDDYDDQS